MLLTIAAVALAVPLALYLFQDNLIFFPQPVSEAHRTAIERQFPEVDSIFIEAADGTRLHAWHVKAPAGAPLVIYFGGNAEEVSWMIPRARERAPMAGWLLVDYRGYGSSGGSPSEAALTSDALAWYQHVRDTIRASEILVFGRSLGSGVAVNLAAARPLGGVVLVAPFDSLIAVGQRYYPFLPVRLMLKHRFDSVTLAARVKAPLLCLVAQRDEVIPVVHSRRLYDAWAGPKRWVELLGAGHNSTDDAPAFWEAIREFLTKKSERLQPA